MTKFWVLYREPDAAEPTYWRTWGEWYATLADAEERASTLLDERPGRSVRVDRDERPEGRYVGAVWEAKPKILPFGGQFLGNDGRPVGEHAPYLK